MGGPPDQVCEKGVPAGAASRVSLQRGVTAGVGIEARHHGSNGVQSLGKHADSREVSLLFLAPARWYQGDKDQMLRHPSKDKDKQNK